MCVNPGRNLKECMDRAKSTILFSATLLPLQYHKNLLGGVKEDYEVYAKSIFDPSKRGLLIASDVTSKYTRRGTDEYRKIARYIHEITLPRPGNYMVFFPSYKFAKEVYDIYEAEFKPLSGAECLMQSSSMDEAEREAFLARFRGDSASILNPANEDHTHSDSSDASLNSSDADLNPSDAGLHPSTVSLNLSDVSLNSSDVSLNSSTVILSGAKDLSLFSGIDMEIEVDTSYTLIGFCVMGGIFSEGIDLKNDSLIGVIVVGTGIPQVCLERELMKSQFDEEGDSGYDYSYKYPGMNKVLQAAGRVIRTEQDTGIVALLDERFLQRGYRDLFPREWMNYQVVNADNVSEAVTKFWDGL
jgi:Rad3-related DNA helicase